MSVTIDLVTERTDGSFCLYLVEEGPWPRDDTDRLQALQKRRYDAVEAVAVGKLVERFPDSKGRNVCIRLDCYDVPAAPVDSLFGKFEEFLRASPEWSTDCRSVTFEISHSGLRKANQSVERTGALPRGSTPFEL